MAVGSDGYMMLINKKAGALSLLTLATHGLRTAVSPE